MDSYEPKADQTDDCFIYPGELYRLMTPELRRVLIDNTARNMGGVTDNIRLRHAAHCYLADPEYGTLLAEALMVPLDKVKEVSKLGYRERMLATGAK
jgi:catalase